MTLICAKFDANLVNISKVTSRKTKWPRFFGLPGTRTNRTRTVLCERVVRATAQVNGKFDPLPRPNPLTDHHRRRRHRSGGGTCPQISDSGGTGGTTEFMGALVKKNKNIKEKAKYSAKEVFSVSSLGNRHTATHQQLCRSHCILCRRRQQSDTASVRRHPVSQSGKRNPESTHYIL